MQRNKYMTRHQGLREGPGLAGHGWSCTHLRGFSTQECENEVQMLLSRPNPTP